MHAQLEAVLQLAVSDMPGAGLQESLTITLDGEPVTAAEVVIPGEGRTHVLTVRPGLLAVDYSATVDGRSAPAEVTPADRLIYTRQVAMPSRTS